VQIVVVVGSRHRESSSFACDSQLAFIERDRSVTTHCHAVPTRAYLSDHHRQPPNRDHDLHHLRRCPDQTAPRRMALCGTGGIPRTPRAARWRGGGQQAIRPCSDGGMGRGPAGGGFRVERPPFSASSDRDRQGGCRDGPHERNPLDKVLPYRRRGASDQHQHPRQDVQGPWDGRRPDEGALSRPHPRSCAAGHVS
jgi:hypothetical protein